MSAGPSRPSLDAPGQLALVDDLGSSGPGSPEMTIGEVLTHLQVDFPELTISKIRYYERQGLLTPARSASGYRKFSTADVRRLHYVLTAARDEYLPLRVIRERLAVADGTGSLPPAGEREPVPAQADPEVPVGSIADEPGSAASTAVRPGLFHFEQSDQRLTRRELLAQSGLDEDQLGELEAYGLIAARGASTTYEAEALTVARIVAELAAYGFQARHLRPVKAAVDREVGLLEQVLTSLLRQPTREARARAEQHARGYAALSVRLHVALLESSLRNALR